MEIYKGKKMISKQKLAELYGYTKFSCLKRRMQEDKELCEDIYYNLQPNYIFDDYKTYRQVPVAVIEILDKYL